MGKPVAHLQHLLYLCKTKLYGVGERAKIKIGGITACYDPTMADRVVLLFLCLRKILHDFIVWGQSFSILASFIPPTAGDHKVSRGTEEDVDIAVEGAQKTRECSIEFFKKTCWAHAQLHGLGVLPWLWWIGRSWGEALDTSSGSSAHYFLEIYRNCCGKMFNWTHTIDVRKLGRQDHWLPVIYRGQ